MRKVLFVLGAISFFAVASTASTSWGATVIGSNLANVPDSNGTCGNPSCTDISISGPGAFASPINGVVVSWSTLGGTATLGTHGSLRLRVFAPAAAGQFTATRSGPATTIPAQPSGHPLITIPLVPGLAIAKNQLIGVDVLNATSAFAQFATTGFTYGFWNSPPPDGVPSSPTTTLSNRENLLQAQIEPDADHDGYGDETQDGCPQQTNTHAACSTSFTVAAAPGKKSVGLTVNVPGSGTVSAGDVNDKTVLTASASKRKE